MPVLDRTAKTLVLQIGESEVKIETGRIGLQSNGAVMVTEARAYTRQLLTST
jgi:polyribonucleotide nucleotidyltransferase